MKNETEVKKSSRFSLKLFTYLFVVALVGVGAMALLGTWLTTAAQKIYARGYFDDSLIAYVNLQEKLEELGATDISVVEDTYITFKIGRVSAQLLKANDEGDSMLYVSSDDSCWIPAFIGQQDKYASFRYFDKNLNISLTDTQIRCIDYAAYTGEFFQKKSGEYHAVYDDIGIWLEGIEPPDYDYDK